MNDEFIYAHRPTPRPKFAAELKAKLDAQATRSKFPRLWFGRMLIAGFLVGGTALAFALFSEQRRIEEIAPAAAHPPTTTSTKTNVAIAVPGTASRDSKVVREEPPQQRATAPAPRATLATSDVVFTTTIPVATSVLVERQRTETYRAPFSVDITDRFDISGAGSAYVYPLLAKWSVTYKQKTGVGLNYQAMGAGASIKEIKANTILFAMTDKPLSPDELKEARLLQFPVAFGAVVPIVNLNGIANGQLRLDGATLAGIYLGEIKTWSDPRIASLNPRLPLPDIRIVPIYRSDGSGTNFLFTSYLSKSSSAFAATVGANTAVEWPNGIGTKGNEGVANMVRQSYGSVAFVEYAYAKQLNLKYTALINRAGFAVVPSANTIQAAAKNDEWLSAPSFSGSPIDQSCEECWPMTAMSSALIHAHPAKSPAIAQAINYFDWSFSSGGRMATDLDYVPVPGELVARIRKIWKQEIQIAPQSQAN